MTTSTIGRFIRTSLSGLDLARRVFLNLVFFIFVLFVVLLFLGPEPRTQIEHRSALVLDPAGMLVDEYDADPLDRALNRIGGRDIPQVRLRDLVDAIERATGDDRIEIIVLDLSGMWPAGMSKLQDMHRPLREFQDAGKRVIAYSNGYGQSQYYLAAAADEIHTHPMGGVYMDGFGSWRVYMREALEKLSMDWHVFKTGDYKSFMEPYTRDDMSEEVREDTRAWLEALWSIYRDDVEQSRGLDAGSIQRYADGLAAGLAEAGGDLALYAEQAGLVDFRSEHDQLESRIASLLDETGNDRGFRSIGWREYLRATQSRRDDRRSGKDGRIAVLVMRGNIVGGDPGLSAVGAERMAEMIGEARRDERVKALVVRIDSPGGSAFASDLIRRELERFKETGRPLVVSMSSVAASGGYWIATPADEIWAQPTTVTGSIGVLAMIPTIPRTMERLGLRTDGVGTTRLSGEFRIDRPLGDEAASILQQLVDATYEEFLDRVEEGRGLERELLHEVAQGRVWSGRDALLIGLVDELGGMEGAIASAASRAGMDDYHVDWLERPMKFRDRVLLNLLDSRVFAPLSERMARAERRPLARLAALLENELMFTLGIDDPRGIYMHCFCTGEPPRRAFNLQGGAVRTGR